MHSYSGHLQKCRSTPKWISLDQTHIFAAGQFYPFAELHESHPPARQNQDLLGKSQTMPNNFYCNWQNF